MRMTWFIRRSPSNAFSGVNSNTQHWSASQKPLRFIKKKKKENSGKRDGHKGRQNDDNN